MARKAMNTEILKQFLKTSGGFHKVLDKVQIIKAANGNCIAELKVSEEHTNPMKTLHGGLTATLVDALTTGALHTLDQIVGSTSVSVDLHMTYLKAAALGEEIVIDSQTIKAGKSVAYLKCQITNKLTGEILAQGTHTKYLMRPRNK